MSYKIGVLGEKDSVMGFLALGLEVCAVSELEEARKALHRMAKEDYAILYITEQLALELQTDIARYRDALAPAIIPIPGKEGSLGLGMDQITQSVERAVGADIL